MISLGLGIIMFSALVSIVTLYLNNNFLQKSLSNEKITNEYLLSEKLALFKDIEDYMFNNNSLNKLNQELENNIEQINKTIEDKELEIIRLNKENGKVNKLKKELLGLNKLKKEHETKILALKETIDKLNTDNNFLNQSLASLTEENKQLAANLDLLSSITADNYLVETTRKKGKLTVVAKRTKKLGVNFKVPENMVETISFKLIKPDGNTVEGNSKDIAVNITDNNEVLYASLDKAELKVSKRIEMTYEPKERLKSGVYKVEIYNKERYIGSCNVKLR
jgi:DNA repair exonuclease SbcCD ATPase subunit